MEHASDLAEREVKRTSPATRDLFEVSALSSRAQLEEAADGLMLSRCCCVTTYWAR
jgi:hypothetical protein